MASEISTILESPRGCFITWPRSHKAKTTDMREVMMGKSNIFGATRMTLIFHANDSNTYSCHSGVIRVLESLLLFRFFGRFFLFRLFLFWLFFRPFFFCFFFFFRFHFFISFFFFGGPPVSARLAFGGWFFCCFRFSFF